MRTVTVLRIHVDLEARHAGVEFTVQEDGVLVRGRHQLPLDEDDYAALRKKIEAALQKDDAELGHPPPAVLDSLLHQVRERRNENQELFLENAKQRSALRATLEEIEKRSKEKRSEPG